MHAIKFKQEKFKENLRIEGKYTHLVDHDFKNKFKKYQINFINHVY